MVICKVGDRQKLAGWRRDVFDLHLVSELPTHAEPFTPKWSERILEWSLLRAPTVLAKAIGIKDVAGMTVLKQVSQVDLYLTVPQALHLIEVKKPSQHKLRHWRAAALEIVTQWEQNEVWLRQGAAAVHLWTLCPIEFKRGHLNRSATHWARSKTSIERNLSAVRRRASRCCGTACGEMRTATS